MAGNTYSVRGSYFLARNGRSSSVKCAACSPQGHLTWEWEGGLRSSLLPGGYAALFLLLRALRLDFQWLVVLLPRWGVALVNYFASILAINVSWFMLVL